MNQRELFREIMLHGEFDRMPVWYTKEWPETAQEWAEQGLSLGVDRTEFFDAVSFPWTIPTDLDREYIGSRDVGRINEVGLRWPTMLLPAFPEETLEETEEYTITRKGDGTVAKEWKHRTGIPQLIDHTFTFHHGSYWLVPIPGMRTTPQCAYDMAIFAGPKMRYV